jgi:hypothetical protein
LSHVVFAWNVWQMTLGRSARVAPLVHTAVEEGSA